MAKINTNSNVYTICYAAVMVVLVAFLLAFVSSALKPAQDANVAIDKKSQILASLNVRGLAKSEVEAKFDELIQETFVLTPDGQEIEGANAFDVETKEIGEYIINERSSMKESEQGLMTVSIKADKETRMGIIADIKQELRRAYALKISYAATQRTSY
jgi:Na+-transporting NADH:ubiquinone oxidoreductase subunit NqrC